MVLLQMLMGSLHVYTYAGSVDKKTAKKVACRET